MNGNDEDRVEEIKYECDMIALCVELGLKRKHGARTFHCPRGENHAQGDIHASFVVYPLTRAFECLVCKDDPITGLKGGWRGDCFKLVMCVKKTGFPEAVDYIDAFNKKLESERKKRGMDGYSGERSEVLHNMPDASMYAPMYSLIWGLGKSVVGFPEIVKAFEQRGISKNTLYQYNVVYLNDLDKLENWLKSKYPNSESLIRAGILTYDGRLKFEGYRTLIPYIEKDIITGLQGWDVSEEALVFINPKNNLPVLLNEHRLKSLKSGSTVIFTDDAMECMSATELYAEPDILPVAPGTMKINSEWLDYCNGMEVKIMMKNMEKAQEIAKAFETIKHRHVEVVDLLKDGATSVNSLLCRKKGLPQQNS